MGNLKTTEKRNLGLHSIFEELFNNESFRTPSRTPEISREASTTPAVNIKENEDGFFLDFALPGVAKEDVIIELENDLLTVSTEKKTEETSETAGYTRREFHYNSFKRNFTLPETIDSSKITADHKDGVLSITIPKKEEAKPKPARKIEIGK